MKAWLNQFTGHLILKMLPIIGTILVVLSLMGSYLSSVIIERLHQSEHEAVAKSFHKVVANVLANTTNQLNSIANNDLIINGLIDTQERGLYIPTFFDSWRISGVKEGLIALVDYKGRPIASNTGKNLKDIIPWKSHVLENGESLQVLTDEGLLIVEPVRYQGNVEGAIGFFLAVKHLNQLFNFGSGKFNVRLRASNGTAIYQTASVFDKQVPDSGIGYVHEISYGLVDTLESSAFSDQLQIQANIILTATVFLILGVGFFLSFIAARFATVTISDLSNKIESVHKTMNLSIRLNYQDEPEELQLLAEEFNNMLKKLEDSTLSKQRMSAMLNSISVYFVVYDCDGNIILTNREFNTLIDTSSINKRDIDHCILGKEKAELIRERGIENSWLTTLSTYSHYKIIEWTRTRFYNDHNRLTGYIFVGIDISEKIHKEEELLKSKNEAERANRIKSEFLANMSHEIRTPMNAIIGMNELLLSTDLQDRQLDYVEKSQNAAKNLLGLLNDILDFSKIEAGKLEVESIDFDIQAVFEGLSDLISIKNHNVKSYFDIDADIPRYLVGDPLRLNQILTNLISNALKFTSSGHVNLEAKVIERNSQKITIAFSVSDTGIGISKDQIKKLFTPFTQADGSTTRKFGGTGLGLSISKVLVELMQGQIEVHSESSVGSRFTASIPFYFSEESKNSQEQPIYPHAYTYINDWHTNHIAEKLLTDLNIRLTTLSHCKDIDTTKPSFLIIDEDNINRIDFSAIPESIHIVLLSYHGLNMRKLKNFNLSVDDVVQLPLTLLGLSRKLLSIERITHENNVEDLTGCRILVVDDNMINREIAKELLSQYGAVINEAEDGQDALNQVLKHDYDIILMDIHMPVMDGYESSFRINQALREKAPAIIALSAKAMEEDKLEAEKSGMCGYVSKPFNIDDLHQEIIKHWER